MKILKPKYKLSDSVKFTFGNESNTGTIVVVDKGIFGDPYNVQYNFLYILLKTYYYEI